MHERWKVSWLLGILMLAGCGDDSGDDGVGSTQVTGPVPEAEFVDRFGRAACMGLEVCCEQAGFGFNASTCRLLISAAGQNGTGNTTYDAEAAAACLNELQDADIVCDSGVDTPSCERVYVGALEPGEACASDAECRAPEGASSECDVFDEVCVMTRRGKGGDACNWTCEELGTSGWVCSGSNGADLPEFTNVECYVDDGLSCQAGVCMELAGPGEACGVDDDCAPGHRCDSDGVCVAFTALGEACESFGECSPEAHCGSTSRACETDSGEGEPCTEDEECVGGVCDGDVCGPDDALSGLADFGLALLCGGG